LLALLILEIPGTDGSFIALESVEMVETILDLALPFLVET
jgi:hypothetical protein